MTMEHTTEKPMITNDIYFSTTYLRDMVWDMEYGNWETWWVSPLYKGYDDYISGLNELVDNFNDRNNECYLDFDREHYECREDMIEKTKITITKYEVEAPSEDEEDQEGWFEEEFEEYDENKQYICCDCKRDFTDECDERSEFENARGDRKYICGDCFQKEEDEPLNWAEVKEREQEEQEEQEDLRSCDCCGKDRYESGELMVYSNLINTDVGDWVCLECSKHPDYEKTYGKAEPDRFTRMNVGDTFEVQENLLDSVLEKAQFIRLCEIFVEEFNENNTETRIEMEHTEKDSIVSVRYIKVLKK
jgi:hypothetical protein